MSSMGIEGEDGLDMMPLMQGMMKNLLAKDILYPSLKELNDKVMVIINTGADQYFNIEGRNRIFWYEW